MPSPVHGNEDECLHAMRCMQADIYSFGMLMWEIVMGTMPWERMTVGQIFFAVVQQDARPAVPETFPAGYKDLMEVRPWQSSCRNQI